MAAQTEPAEAYLAVINLPGPNWASPLPATPEMSQQHHAIYQSLLEDGMLISAGRLDGKPMMGISLFQQGVDESVVRARLDSDELVKRGYLTLDYRRWVILTGSLTAAKDIPSS